MFHPQNSHIIYLSFVELIKEFLDLLLDITNKNKIASSQVEDATKRVLMEIDCKGIDLQEYLSDLKQDSE